ncbi:hypothetical protein SCYAM73S_00847 [Streptomyces cyaneofuscatus]
MQDERGLARAVGAEDRDTLTAPHGEVHPEEGLVAVGVGVGEAADIERGGGGPGILRGEGHRVHPSRQTASASTGRAAAYAHWVRSAVTSSITGIVPA